MIRSCLNLNYIRHLSDIFKARAYPPAKSKLAYHEWIKWNDILDESDRLLIRSHATELVTKPFFSILLPVYDPPVSVLSDAIDSVLGQLYENWELCIADDASKSSAVKMLLQDYSKSDSRIKITTRETNGGISACTNTALNAATGDWIVLLDHDDILAEHALYLIAHTINVHPGTTILYSDEDCIDMQGTRHTHYFKPDFDYDLFLVRNIICHLGAYRTDVARRIGGFREGFEGSQDWDFALRAIESAPIDSVRHIPYVLYHWRRGIGTFSEVSVDAVKESTLKAVNEHLSRTGQSAIAVSHEESGHLQIKRELPHPAPLVSIIIPTRDRRDLLESCINSILHNTDYPEYEIIIIDNDSVEHATHAYFNQLQLRPNIRILNEPGPFNFSRLVNRGVAQASGEICILLNNDVTVITSGWIKDVVDHAIRREVGVVGVKLYYPDDTLQHGGVITGSYHPYGNIAGHVHRYARYNSKGYRHRLNLAHSLSAVTAACLAVRRAVYDEIGGFDENNLAVAYNDVDFCLRAREAGYRIIWTPNAELYHGESQSRGISCKTSDDYNREHAERGYMLRRWGEILNNDLYYNPNLSLRNLSFKPAATTRVCRPWYKFNIMSQALLDSGTILAMETASQKSYIDNITMRRTHADGFIHDINKYVASRIKRVVRNKDDMKIAVYTAVSGAHNIATFHTYLDPGYDYVLFSDSEQPDSGIYDIRPINKTDCLSVDPVLYVKTHPHHFLRDYDIAVWVDPDVMLVDDIKPFLDDFINSGKPVAAVQWPGGISLDPCHVSENDMDSIAESSFIMIKIDDERATRFLEEWWQKATAKDKKRQGFFNRTVFLHDIAWHSLLERPNNIRNHNSFSVAKPETRAYLTSRLASAIRAPTIDPQAHRKYACIREERISLSRDINIEIIICVHNALDHVERCLASILRTRTGDNQRLIIIDDGSDKHTADYLINYVSTHAEWTKLYRNENTQGYTKSANQGLSASTAEFVILLNSDTIVTDGWVEKMADAVFSIPDAGIVGPMSNAARFQSIPEYRGKNKQSVINELPPGLTPEDMNRFCEYWTVADKLPIVSNVHGFCFGIKRQVIDRIGYFDTINFPSGYGEEEDYCFRAVNAGFKLIIATHTFVFHAKSKSYPDSLRIPLMEAASNTLASIYGGRHIKSTNKQMKHNPVLCTFRERARELTTTAIYID